MKNLISKPWFGIVSGLVLYFLILKPLAGAVQTGIRAADLCEEAGTGAWVEVRPRHMMKCH